MSAIRSWASSNRLELAWALFAAINLVVTARLVNYETVPFHFVWVSLTLVYGWKSWRLSRTLGALALVCAATALTLGWVVLHGPQGPDELTEVPLMAAMFLAMVWHNERRVAALRQASQAAQREQEFVRAASHQLKTPIAIARGLASLMRQEGAAGEEDLDALNDELRRLERIADDLLLLASSEQAGSLVRTQVDVEDLIVSAARRWSRATERVWNLVPCDGVLLRADRHRLDCALDALLENAVAATTARDRITLAATAEGETLSLIVADTGAGIPPENLSRVFERFWSSTWWNGHQRGTGLGLPIVQAIAEAHDGDVSLVSQVGLGTTVTVHVPGFRPAGVNGYGPAALHRDSTAVS
jgi:signal transduction histidine kinase